MEEEIGVGLDGPPRSNLCFALGCRTRWAHEAIRWLKNRSSDEYSHQPKSVGPPCLDRDHWWKKIEWMPTGRRTTCVVDEKNGML